MRIDDEFREAFDNCAALVLLSAMKDAKKQAERRGCSVNDILDEWARDYPDEDEGDELA